MNKSRSLVWYSVIRVALFAVIFTGLMLLDVAWYFSAGLAALISLCISYIFLSKARDDVSRTIYEVRHRESEPVREDDAVEDAVLDGPDGPDGHGLTSGQTVKSHASGADPLGADAPGNDAPRTETARHGVNG